MYIFKLSVLGIRTLSVILTFNVEGNSLAHRRRYSIGRDAGIRSNFLIRFLLGVHMELVKLPKISARIRPTDFGKSQLLTLLTAHCPFEIKRDFTHYH